MAKQEAPQADTEDQGKDRKKYFVHHVKAIADSARSIKNIHNRMKTTTSDDERGDLHKLMDTEIAQLHLSVNNAVDTPDDHPENTGGRRDGAIDPNAKPE